MAGQDPSDLRKLQDAVAVLVGLQVEVLVLLGEFRELLHDLVLSLLALLHGLVLDADPGLVQELQESQELLRVDGLVLVEVRDVQELLDQTALRIVEAEILVNLFELELPVLVAVDLLVELLDIHGK